MELGHEVGALAPSVSTALALIETETFDAAILDINLGEESVFPVADALLALGVPYVFATGYDAGVMALPRAHEDRMRIGKPYVRSEIEDALMSLG